MDEKAQYTGGIDWAKDVPPPVAPKGNPSGFLVGGFLLPDDGLLAHAPRKTPPHEKPDGDRVGSNTMFDKPKRKRPHEKPSGFTTYETWKPPSPLKLFVGIFGGVAAVCALLFTLYVVGSAFDITLQRDPLEAIVAIILFICLLAWSLIVLAGKLP